MKNTLNKSHIIETIEGCYDIIDYLLTTNSVTFKTKTEVVYCAFTDSWKHFCLLRSSMAVSGKPHPDIVPLADNIAEYLHFK